MMFDGSVHNFNLFVFGVVSFTISHGLFPPCQQGDARAETLLDDGRCRKNMTHGTMVDANIIKCNLIVVVYIHALILYLIVICILIIHSPFVDFIL